MHCREAIYSRVPCWAVVGEAVLGGGTRGEAQRAVCSGCGLTAPSGKSLSSHPGRCELLKKGCTLSHRRWCEAEGFWA